MFESPDMLPSHLKNPYELFASVSSWSMASIIACVTPVPSSPFASVAFAASSVALASASVAFASLTLALASVTACVAALPASVS